MDGSEDMFVILHRTDIMGDLYCILDPALAAKLMDALDTCPALEGVVVF